MIAPAFAVALACLGAGDDSPEARALAYLAAEVPRWSAEHHCYSCHNNGDAARALYQGVQLGRPVPPAATLDTDRWLAGPGGWDRNGGDGPFNDRRLARLQFASTLASAVESGRVVDRAPLLLAADRLADDQAADGSWPVEDGGLVGSPATYGRPLGTWLAREVLRSADAPRHRARIDRADAWLRLQPFPSVMDASTLPACRGLRRLPRRAVPPRPRSRPPPPGPLARRRLGPVREGPARSLRHRPGPSGARPPPRPAGRPRPDRKKPVVPGRIPAGRRLLARDHPTRRCRELRPACLHHRLVRASLAGHSGSLKRSDPENRPFSWGQTRPADPAFS